MAEPKLNTAVTEAIEWLLKPGSSPVNHGEFNRRMFLEAVFVKGGQGVSVDKEDICRHGALTDKEFNTIKDEWITKGVIKEEKNFCGVVLYSMEYDPKGGGLDNLPKLE